MTELVLENAWTSETFLEVYTRERLTLRFVADDAVADAAGTIRLARN